MSEERARSFLSSNSYFFKIKSYENNYQKIYNGNEYQYADLDFGYLVEISLIDFALSRLVWSLCSSIEHSVKLRFNTKLMEDPDPDIAEKCVRYCWRGKIPELHDNPYTNDLLTSCQDDYAPWHLWELLGFNDQLRLYSAYFKRKKEPTPMGNMLFIVRKMRNAVSHGNCLLTDMNRLAPTKNDENRTDLEVTNAAMRMCDKNPRTRGQRANAFQQSLNKLVINNYAAVLLCHLELVDGAHILSHARDEVQHFVNRLNLRRDQYFGDKGVRQPRNPLVDSTLSALVILSKGYLRKAKAKAKQLSADDPYGMHKDTPEKIEQKLFRRHERINRLRMECSELETKARFMKQPETLIVNDYTSIDLETTGFSESQDRIIELGAVRIRKGKPVLKYKQLVNPGRKLDAEITKLTGITDEELADQPTIETALPNFLKFIANDTLIGHNIDAFDSEFIATNTARLRIPKIMNNTVDTLALSKVLYPEQSKHRLVDLIRRFNIGQTEAHRAADDALQTAQCYEKMKLFMKSTGTK